MSERNYIPISRVEDIQPGMHAEMGGDIVEFVREVNGEADKDTNGHPIFNKNRNKWWCRITTWPEKEERMLCFDETKVFSLVKFYWP